MTLRHYIDLCYACDQNCVQAPSNPNTDCGFSIDRNLIVEKYIAALVDVTEN
jgi:hypothetical protein